MTFETFLREKHQAHEAESGFAEFTLWLTYLSVKEVMMYAQAWGDMMMDANTPK